MNTVLDTTESNILQILINDNTLDCMQCFHRIIIQCRLFEALPHEEKTSTLASEYQHDEKRWFESLAFWGPHASLS